ncbi:hypothetical protein [Faecalibaculum rodentium]|jgi:hypothetical protein|uniref:hypothetical protein n=1 Tax=Faecalibaculum rodentium TaxID=1702221 RepID=UPI0026F3C4FE|nr:hypothetical protein [Faecalibaculum rodentium]
MADVYAVVRYTKTKSVEVGCFDTEDAAKTAMIEHFRSTPKRGKFYYRITQEGRRKIDGIMFREFDSSKPSWKYTREQLEAMVCTT